MAKFCVVIPAYNAARYLPEAVGSVQRQQGAVDWEVVVADDGSTDDSAAVVARLAAEDRRVRGVAQANAGVSVARNLGAAHASPDCQYLWFLDADDGLAPDALGRMGAYLDAHPDVGLLGCQFQLMHDDGTLAGPEKRSRWAPGRPFGFPRQLRDDERSTPFETFFCGTGQGPFALYRRGVFARTDGWEPRLRCHEDADMFCQMALLADVHYLPDRLYLKRIHPGQITNTADPASAQSIWDNYDVFRQKWDTRPGRNEHETHLLRRARAFYNGRFQPCRDLKLAFNIWRELLRGRLGRDSAHHSLTILRKAIPTLLRPAA